MIVQITKTRNELFLIKEMLPLWQKYADAFVFMDNVSDDGTYEFLLENSSKYNILSVMRTDRDDDKLTIESTIRQRLFDEALKHSGNIVCLDTDEYFDGTMSKEQLESLMTEKKDTLFHSLWIQYTSPTRVRVDGPWRINWMDRIGSYSKKATFRHLQLHAEHLPVPENQLWIQFPHLFVAHIQWLDKKQVGLKQYYYKILDYVNRTRFGADTVKPQEYDKSVNNFLWNEEEFPFPLKIRNNIYESQPIEKNHKYKYIVENVPKFGIPNLNDWGLGIHDAWRKNEQ